jgi:hypothetical protein
MLTSNLQDDNGGDEPNTKSSNKSTTDHNVKTRGGSLEDATDAKDTTAHDDGHSAADEIGKVTSDDSTEEGT